MKHTKRAEPILIKAGSNKVRLGLNGTPPLVDCRVIAEAYYQEMLEIKNDLLEALTEISKGDGAYDMDRLKHASNVIENMKSIAELAIKKATQ